jgi:hypothetical protein
MRGTVAALGATGALLIPSSSGPSNAKLQSEVVNLQRQVATLKHDLRCENAYANTLDARIRAIEAGTPQQPGGTASSQTC